MRIAESVTKLVEGSRRKALPIVLASIQRKLTSITINEYADMSLRDSPDMIFNLMGFGSTPEKLRATIVSERCARLPRSLARSALMRATITSWL